MKARLAPDLHMLTRDGESVVLVGHIVVRLSELPTAIMSLLSTDHWLSAVEVMRQAQDRLGPAATDDEALRATESALLDLQRYELVDCSNE